MPRKATKTDKPPLQFLERPLCGARLQNVPEVRSALNPREFFKETSTHNKSSLSSWVSPQFDSSLTAAAPVKRGRRKCQSATNIIDSCSQLSKKNSVCKFPSLSFHRKTRDHSQQQKRVCTNKVTEPAAVSVEGNQKQKSCKPKRIVSNAQFSDTPKRQPASIRRKNKERFSDGAAPSTNTLQQSKNLAVSLSKRCGISPEGVLSPASTEVSCVDPPPDVDTPKAVQDRKSPTSSASVGLLSLLAPPCSPPNDLPPDILVPDTPERDYGLKVTWRRRRDLMMLLKERGHLFDADVVIHS